MKAVVSVHADVNETNESGDNQSSVKGSRFLMYLKMMLQFPFICYMMSKKLSNVRQLVQCSRELLYFIIKDDLKVVLYPNLDVTE